MPYLPVTPTSVLGVSNLVKRGGGGLGGKGRRWEESDGLLFVRFVMIAICIAVLGEGGCLDVLLAMLLALEKESRWSGFA